MKEMNIPQVRAEMLLNYLYPELEERWVARCEGTFYRNYNQDILSLTPEENEVALSRDGFLNLLPKGLLSMEDDLRHGDRQEKHNELEEQLKVLREAFLPFDSLAFRRQLKIERQVSQLLDDKLHWMLKTYFDFDLAAEQNPYVRSFAVLLPYVRQLRGDFGMIRRLLSAVFGCPVRFSQRRYSELDSTRYWIPCARFDILVPDLSAAACRELYEALGPLKAFLEEWFMPLECHLELLIREEGSAAPVDRGAVLDYNVEL